MANRGEIPQVEFRSRAALRGWLAKHRDRDGSVWAVFFKKGSPHYIPYGDIRDEALCFGWIDSRPAKLDDARSMLLLSPRRAGSAWSAVNKRRVAALIREGRMTPAGLAKIDAAKADGSWTFLDDVETLAPPDDLILALRRFTNAERHFDAFPPSVKRGILEWIKQAKRPETRARRIEETARLAEDNIRARQTRQPKER